MTLPESWSSLANVCSQLEELLALPDIVVKECCSQSLKRLCSVLHIHANKQWGDGEVVMVNADGNQTAIPGFMWPPWRLAECKQPFKSLINLYLSISQVSWLPLCAAIGTLFNAVVGPDCVVKPHHRFAGRIPCLSG